MNLDSLKELLGRSTPRPWGYYAEGVQEAYNGMRDPKEFDAGIIEACEDWEGHPDADPGLLIADMGPDVRSFYRADRDAALICQLVNAADELVAVAQMADKAVDAYAAKDGPQIDEMDYLAETLELLRAVLGGEGKRD